MDFTPDDAGTRAFPHDHVINPYQNDAAFIEWTTEDWDSALRFWTLPYDPHLIEWLQAVDPSQPSILAAREFGGQPTRWQFDRAKLLARGWMEAGDLKWQPDETKRGGPAWDTEKDDAWEYVKGEIEQLKQLMEDDRERYLAEIDVQADGLADYFISFLGAHQGRHAWTIEYINCGLAIGNVAYMYYKQQFRRVRPSTLCPGLIPPFGPPGHPSFPSGHSFLGHLISLLLLEIPAIRERYGIFEAFDGTAVEKPVNPYPQPTTGKSVTISVANPAVVAWNAHKLKADDAFAFRTTDTLPPPVKPGMIYFVRATGLSANQFQFSVSPGGPAVSTSGSSQTGAHQASAPPPNPLKEVDNNSSPMLWLAQRLAKNRERLGVHYASDSSSSRHLAAGIWRGLLHEKDPNGRINCPTLNSVLVRATAEWPTKLP